MIIASLNDYRQSPRKVRLVANLVKGKQAEKAVALLGFTIKEASCPIKKLIESALANAKNSSHVDPSELYIKDIQVNPGLSMKRSMPRARGSAFPIRKRTSHISLVLDIKASSSSSKSKKASRATKAKTEDAVESIKTTK